jgi:nucleoside-diphosphate kinase
MAYERTFAIIKPDGMEFQEEVMKRIQESGLKIVRQKKTVMTSDIAKQFYYHVKVKRDDVIYQSVIDYMTSGEIIALELEGEDAVQGLRKLIGCTDPEKAGKGTIRGDFGTDKMRIADSENRSTKNIIHASGSIEESLTEKNYFF